MDQCYCKMEDRHIPHMAQGCMACRDKTMSTKEKIV